MAEFDGRIGHLEGIESPWGNAGGVVKTVEDVEQMAHTGVGWIEAGSYTLEPRIGNSPNGERVYYHNDQTGETFNSLGMPNKGMDVVEAEIPEMARIAHAYNKKLIINVAPVSDKPSDEFKELAGRAWAAGADAVLLNAGCPNVVTDDGGRHEILSLNAMALLEVLVNLHSPVFVRVSPIDDVIRATHTLDMIQWSKKVSAVFTPNTWPGYKPTDANGEAILEVPGGTGGKSGPAMQFGAEIQTKLAVDTLRPHGIDVVSSSSIVNAEQLRRRIHKYIGAVAGAGTTFFYESQNGWKEDTDKLLSELAA